jgi:hypothetical protein
MNKKIILSSFASLLFLSQAANSEIKVGNLGVITGTVGAATQYISKGIDSNRDQATANLTAEFASSTDIQIILGSGIFYSRPDKPVTSSGAYDYELDYNIGLRKTIGMATLDIGHLSFTYPSAASNLNLDSSAYYAKAAIAATKETTFTIYYEQDDTEGTRASNSTKLGKRFYELSLSSNLGPVTANLAYGDFDRAVTYTKVGVAKEITGLNFTADYISNNKDSASYGSAKNNEFIVVGVTKSF